MKQPPNQSKKMLNSNPNNCNASLSGKEEQLPKWRKQKFNSIFDGQPPYHIKNMLNPTSDSSVASLLGFVFSIHSVEVHSCHNTYNDNDGDKNNSNNTSNNCNNSNSSSNNNITDREIFSTQQNVNGNSGNSGGNGNNDDDDKDGSNSRNGEILSTLIYFLQLGRLLLVMIFHHGRLYLAICQLLHVQLTVGCHDLTFFHSCPFEAVSVYRYQLTMLNPSYIKLTVDYGNTAMIVFAKGMLSHLCNGRQPSLVLFELPANIFIVKYALKITANPLPIQQHPQELCIDDDLNENRIVS